MKKLLLTLFVLLFGLGAFASEQDEALNFFKRVVNASNNYSTELKDMYSNNSKITREVIKPDGKTVDVYFAGSDYKAEMERNAKLAKLVGYKNYYSRIKISKVADGYRIDAMRRPSPSNYNLKYYMVVQKQPNGKWIVAEEFMQTKVQTFLKYAK